MHTFVYVGSSQWQQSLIKSTCGFDGGPLYVSQPSGVCCEEQCLPKHISEVFCSILTCLLFLSASLPLFVPASLFVCISSLLQLVLSGPVMYYNNIHTPPLAFSPHAAHSPLASHATHPAHTPHTPLAAHASSHPQYPAQPFMTGMPFPFRPSH